MTAAYLDSTSNLQVPCYQVEPGSVQSRTSDLCCLEIRCLEGDKRNASILERLSAWGVTKYKREPDVCIGQTGRTTTKHLGTHNLLGHGQHDYNEVNSCFTNWVLVRVVRDYSCGNRVKKATSLVKSFFKYVFLDGRPEVR